MLTLRDLFQVVFEMKKQEVEAAKARKQRGEEKQDEKTAEKGTTEKPACQPAEGVYDVGILLSFTVSTLMLLVTVI